jgi:hypothetical protein
VPINARFAPQAAQSTISLKDARQRLVDSLDEGVTCPCCEQFAKVYRFRINASMAVALTRIWRAGGVGWVDVPALQLPHGLHAHLSKLRFWGLLERPEGLRRGDGSTRVGIWRVTEHGQRWINREITVPSHARIYDNRCLGLVGEPTSIDDALGATFNYDELMMGV